MTLSQISKALNYAKETITNMLNDAPIPYDRLTDLASQISKRYGADNADAQSVIEVAIDDLGLDY
jgi:hypothetical protein